MHQGLHSGVSEGVCNLQPNVNELLCNEVQ